MKKYMKMALILLAVVCTLTACGQKVCHECGDAISGDPVEAGGRVYCSYNCYMNEVLFG